MEFAIKTAWLLDAYTIYLTQTGSKVSQGVKLKNQIINNELKPLNAKSPGFLSMSGTGNMLMSSKTTTDLTSGSPATSKPFKKEHNRSRSDATGIFDIF